MKIATFNVNGVNGRLPLLLDWLAEAAPDVACLQELKAPDERFPAAEIEKAGYGAIWHGQKSWNGVAILARGAEPVETQRGLPGDPDDVQSRYLEAAVNGILIGCLYLPNGNPVGTAKFAYKLKWMERFAARAAELAALDGPVVLAGDYNVIPTEADAYKPEPGWTKPSSTRSPAALKGCSPGLDRRAAPILRRDDFTSGYAQRFARNAGIRSSSALNRNRAVQGLKAAGSKLLRSSEKRDPAQPFITLKQS